MPTPKPMTMAEKIFARTAGLESCSTGDYVTASADRIMVNDMFTVVSQVFTQTGVSKLPAPEKAVIVFDHVFPAPKPELANMIARSGSMIEALGIENYLGSPGIAHQVLCERGFVAPGNLVIGSDSHSTMYGALGAAGAGLGATEIAYSLAMDELWFQVPESVRITLVGDAAPGFSAKDLMLYLLGRFGCDFGQYRSLEYVGPVAEALSISQRMTIANMGAEIGAKFAMFEADEKTVAYVSERCDDPVSTFAADEAASYAEKHTVDISNLTPQVACPNSPDNVKPVSEVSEQAVDQAYLGSCTNARLDDLAIAAEILEGQRVARGTRLLVAPASQQIMLEATRAGYIETLVAAGAHVLPSGCGACAGIHSGLLGETEACISSTNRNFPGRMGHVDSQLFLGSPATVAASAIRGKITDPREFWQAKTF